MNKNDLISLGMNCEVSFQIEKYLGKIEASLFSWAFIENEELFLNALNNIDDIFSSKISFAAQTEDMFWCEQYRIAFHGRTNKKLMLDDNNNIINETLYNECISELKTRIDYLKIKFKKQLEAKEKTVFIKKLDVNHDISRAEKIIKALYDYFTQNSKYGNWQLVIVVESAYSNNLQHLQNEKLFIYPVAFFAPADNTRDGADNESWKAIIMDALYDNLKQNIENTYYNDIEQVREYQTKCLQYEFELQKLKLLLAEKDKWINELQEGKAWLERQYLELIQLPEEARQKISKQ